MVNEPLDGMRASRPTWRKAGPALGVQSAVLLVVSSLGVPACKTAAPATALSTTNADGTWPNDDNPTPDLKACRSAVSADPAEANSGIQWEPYCLRRFEDALTHLGWWKRPELAEGILACGHARDGATVVSYNLKRPDGATFLAEVASARGLADRKWDSTFGDASRPGRATMFGEHAGHAVRVVANDPDPVGRETLFAAFMPQIKYCVGDKTGVHVDRFEVPPER
jgi:hypothetical protein